MTVRSDSVGEQPRASGDSWCTHAPEEVVAAFDVDPAVGLSAARAAQLLSAHGPNSLPEERRTPAWRRFLRQYRSYMQIVLVAAAIVSLLIEQWTTAILLIVLTLLNAVVGLRQEGKAESAMNALQSMMKATARVRRDGTEAEIPAEQLVVGDIVLIAAGDQVAADGRIIEASALQIDESALTGESVPASKDARTLPGLGPSPGDQTNMAFMNTPVTHGSGVLVVTATGAGTEVGKISGMLSATEKEVPPLTRELDALTLWITGAAGLTMIVMFALGRQRDQAWDVLFVSAVSLAIAAIPEALPTVTQAILSVGSLNLAKWNAIVKELPSVETLAFTSAINSDKTGTLTMNQMTAVEVVSPTDRYTVSGTGYGLDGKVHHAAGSSTGIEDAILPYVVASDAKLVDGKVVGDPTEGALLVLGHKAGLDIDATRESLPRLATLPFDPGYKLMATFNSAVDASGRQVVRCFVKGAVPAVMARAATALAAGETIPWDAELVARAEAQTERMGGEGRRVMAAATRDLDPAGFDPDGDLLAYVTELRMVSLVGMVDPPREDAKAAIAGAQAGHIRVRMVTGDDVTTGAAIARQLGIPGEAVLGADFAAMSADEQLARIDGIGVVGRVAPEHKVLLADTLKKKGDVVAMTGDGVNDAPAIKAADIGIAMGSGTDVAKNAGRMILSDDKFATIVYAVEQGRRIYDNLTKYIRFVLLLLVTFVLTFLGATVFNIAAGEPFTPPQVLWIHFVVNASFGFALGFDRESPGLMRRRPRPRGESVLTRPVLVTVGVGGLAITVVLLGLIKLGQAHFDSVEIGRSIAFTAFALCLIVAAFECRSETDSVLTTSTFDSKQMNWVALAQFALAVLVTQLDGFRRILGTTQINARQFGWALLAALALLLLWELGKLLARRSRGT
ncbi:MULTISPECIES: HAD-IC family P-type ATPase [unclassified Streptomyces]|uniref:cation-translocating P-type ATPase n=1 Tax=unclassified Streptomyces TaxID=2593676 RepID=UPI0011646F9E|nr:MULTISPECIES: HAD-IC family P-type ATPase [unclassified Streptomyces]NMI59743.1 HAD-IC family P-type ATPase [Streptomyces sp. RLA2-12]QDN58988.1 HAD-IC family P-type ATPase [Streptomyces sp. S1D4-20]QDN69053.1 HAD-IC family P-type ATPase [Streptomyces sp. S1D4-14]QDO51471.1 HAD-IC family P-type ATPase [Streptomyces sp. RLB3-5]QDO61709.1 HAD-IC family P-type ATPase [Streptomyces sp. RLB1-8]